MKPNPHYVLEKYLLPFKYDAFKLENPNDFSVLYRRDLINFFKRLRFHLNKELGNYEKKEKPVCLRYYGVGEYGPTTLRPHYHAIVFLDDQKAARIFSHCVFKSWKYGLYDCQLSDSGQAIGYVAKYVNSFSFVPKILNLPWSKPFSVHSQNFGVSPYEDAYKELAELEYGRVGTREYQIDGRFKSVDAPFSLQSALFPKCYAYGVSSHSLNLVRYRLSAILFDEMRRRGEEEKACSVKEMAQYFVDNDVLLCDGRYSIFDLFPECKCDDVVQTVMSALYLSNKFLRLCDRYGTSPWYYYYRVIVPWYADREMNYLNKSLLRMEEDFQLSSCSPLNLVHRYSNIPYLVDFSMGDWAQMDISFSFPALQHFADSIGFSVDEVLMVAGDKTQDSFAPYQHYLQAKIFRDNQKHKELNDKNYVLYSPHEFYRLKKELHEI